MQRTIFLALYILSSFAFSFQVSLQVGGVPGILSLSPNDNQFVISISLQSTDFDWIAVGVPSNHGLGGSLMVGGSVIYRKPKNTVMEYSMLENAVVREYRSGIQDSDITSCASTYCQDEAQKCFIQSRCASALRCFSEKGDSLPTNVTDASLTSSLLVFDECLGYIYGTGAPDEVSALASVFEGVSCFVKNCCVDLVRISTQRPSLNATSVYFRETLGTTSEFSFALTKRQIAGVAFHANTSIQTFILAVGKEEYNQIAPHSPLQRMAISVDLLTGMVVKGNPAPGWLLAHALMGSLAFALILPLSLCGKRRFPVSAFFLFFLSVCVAVLAVIVASSNLSDNGEKETSSHKLLGIVTLLVTIVFLLLSLFSSESDYSEALIWNYKVRGRTYLPFNCFPVLIKSLAILSWALISSTFFTGSHDVKTSSVELDVFFMQVVPIGGTVLLGLATLIAFGPFPCSSKPCNNRKTQSKEDLLSAAAAAVVVVDEEKQFLHLTLTWRNVSLTVRNNRTAKTNKRVLSLATGEALPNTLTAILGPSGSGKSTLLTILSLRNHDHHQTLEERSEVLVNNSPAESIAGIHRCIGFVAQEDVLHPHLTVLETLQFACQLLLPPTMAVEEKAERMLRVLSQLGLNHVLDTLVGGSEVRGLSGGERRRVSVALQLLKSPSLLFLDEPTSGLDASNALRIVNVLREVANEGRTVIASIHQPSAKIFATFDRIVLLSAGHTVFSGKREDLLSFLKSNHKEVPTYWNPADWVLSVVDFHRKDDFHEGNDDEVGQAGNGLDQAQIRKCIQAYYQQVNPSKLHENIDEVIKLALGGKQGIQQLESLLLKQYGVSLFPFLQAARGEDQVSEEQVMFLVQQFQRSVPPPSSTGDVCLPLQVDSSSQPSSQRSQPFMVQIKLLANRSVALIWRNPQALRFQVLQNLVFGVLIGAIFSNIVQLKLPLQQAFALGTILAMVAFVTLSLGTQVAFNDRLVLEREMSDGIFSPFAHFAQRLVVGIPLALFVSLCLILPSYFWIGFKPQVDAVLFFILVNTTVVFLFDSVVFALTLAVSDVNSAYALGNFYEALAAFFSGVFLPMYALPSYLSWLYYLSPFAFAFGASVINEFEGTNNAFIISATGVVLPSKWANLLILFLMGLGWRLLGLVGIIRLFRNKQPGNSSRLSRRNPTSATSQGAVEETV